jgi:uncharacterized protein
MKNDTPIIVDPVLLAKAKRSISGLLNFNKLVRLRDLAEFDDKEIPYSISFFYDEENRCCITGNIKVTVKLECKRCLNLFSYEIDTTFCLYPVVASTEKDFAKQFDVVVMENGLVSISDIIEDELILSLPEVAKHTGDDPNCQQLPVEYVFEQQDEQQENPFQILQNLENTDGKKVK